MQIEGKLKKNSSTGGRERVMAILLHVAWDDAIAPFNNSGKRDTMTEM